MFVQLRTGLVLVKQGELEPLHLLEVVVQHELLGEGWVEVVDSCFCSVELWRDTGMGGRGVVPRSPPWLAAGNLPTTHCLPPALTSHEPQLTGKNTEGQRWKVGGRQVQDSSPVWTLQTLPIPRDQGRSSGHIPDWSVTEDKSSLYLGLLLPLYNESCDRVVFLLFT